MIRPLSLLAVLCLLLAPPAWGAPKAEPWPRWERHDPAAVTTVDHAPWGRFLRRYVRVVADGINRVDYGAVGQDDRRLLEGYLAGLAEVPVTRLNRDEQMAYWINLYNALTVEVVLAHYPVRSIRDIDISPGPFADGPWGKRLVEVESEPLSLDDIEHRILRPIWRDPRVHYAINCAALGCPNLQPTPFTGGHLDHALDEAAMAFVNHPRGVRLDGDKLYASSIYAWFKDDFGGDDRGVIQHLIAYAPPRLALRLQDFSAIAEHGYDWRLNDARPVP